MIKKDHKRSVFKDIRQSEKIETRSPPLLYPFMSSSTTKGWPPCCSGGTQDSSWRSLPHQRPLTLLSGQSNMPILALSRCAICTTEVWQFIMTFGPFQCMHKMLYCSNPPTEGIHQALEAWYEVT